ncbi:MAG: hypothetical protein ACRCSF_13990 [Mycobacteriaceae bacterium]
MMRSTEVGIVKKLIGFGFIIASLCAVIFVPSAFAGEEKTDVLPNAGDAPQGCTFDLGIENAIVLNCSGGDGSIQHAFIRCIDIFGIVHTHIGENISTAGGSSVAACDPNWGEVGPYDGPQLFPRLPF